MTRLRVKAERSHLNLSDVPLIDITNFNTEFTIPIQSQKDEGPWEDFQTLTFKPEEVQPPEPPTPPPEENLLYDSNRDGGWDNGKARTVKDKDGDTSANGKGLYTAASGDPVFEINGKGEGILICKPGHGRIYICACNYNSVLEKEFKIMDGNVDNVSDKLRCRHQEGGDCDNRFGGVGGSISTNESGCKIEVCHNIHADSKSADLPTDLKVGEWYKDRFQVRDSADKKAILATRWLDYGDGKGFVKILEHKMTKIKPYMMDKDQIMKKSYFWLRMNNEDGVGKIAFRNVKLFNIPDA
jgi:hypothetical protein